MTWFRKELVAVFALVLVTVSAMESCNVTKMLPFNVSAVEVVNRADEAIRMTSWSSILAGDYGGRLHCKHYKVLTTRTVPWSSIEYYGFIATYSISNNSILLRHYEKNLKSKCCSMNEYSCEIKNDSCVGKQTTLYVIALNSRSTVIYLKRNSKNAGDIEIYITNERWTKETVGEDVRRSFREMIADACGKDAVKIENYRLLKKADFISHCQNSATENHLQNVIFEGSQNI